MSYPCRIAIAALMGVVALVFLALGALEMVEAKAGLPHPSYRLFFSLAAICTGCAAGVLFA